MTKILRVTIILLLLFFGLSLCIFLIIMKKPPAQKVHEHLPSIKVLRIKKETVIPELSEYGVVKSLEEVKLRAQVSGKVIFCEKNNNGEIVKQGGLILQIEKSDYEITLQKSEAELEILKANLKKKVETVKNVGKMLKLIQEDFDLETARYERAKKLFSRNVYSKNALDSAQQAFAMKNKILIEMKNTESQEKISIESIKAQIKKAEAILEQSKLNLLRTSVKSPINGRVADCDINEGDFLNIGEKICKVINEKQPSLTVPLDAINATNILNVVTGDKHWLELPKDIKVKISWVKKPEECMWAGKVSRIKNYDAETDTLKLLVVPNKYIGSAKIEFPLLSGMFCVVKFQGVPIKNAFKIPFSAIQFGNNVFTVDENGVLHRHSVEIYNIVGNDAIIKEGLPDSTIVVIQQLPRGVVEGMRINPAFETETSDKIN